MLIISTISFVFELLILLDLKQPIREGKGLFLIMPFGGSIGMYFPGILFSISDPEIFKKEKLIYGFALVTAHIFTLLLPLAAVRLQKKKAETVLFG